MTIQEMQQRLSNVTESSLEEVEMRTVLRHQDEYIYQQTRQMYAGKRMDQNLIVPYQKSYYPYVKWYQDWKDKLRGDASRVTLNLYGHLYDNMFITRRDNSVFTISSNVKSADGYNYLTWLEEHYQWKGPNGDESIWGIGGPYLSKFLNIIHGPFLDEVINEFL